MPSSEGVDHNTALKRPRFRSDYDVNSGRCKTQAWMCSEEVNPSRFPQASLQFVT